MHSPGNIYFYFSNLEEIVSFLGFSVYSPYLHLRDLLALTVYGVMPYTTHAGITTMAHAAYAAAKRSRRLDARVTPEEKQIIETAASLRGISVTDLLRTSVNDAATRIIRESEILTLAENSRKVFVEALLSPPKPNEKALAAAKRFVQEVD